jgi:hypothetical protein
MLLLPLSLIVPTCNWYDAAALIDRLMVIDVVVAILSVKDIVDFVL